MENSYLYYAIGAAVLSLLYGSVLIFKILKQPAGSGKMLEIAQANWRESVSQSPV